MVIEEGDMKSQGEVESRVQQEANYKNHNYHSPLFSSHEVVGEASGGYVGNGKRDHNGGGYHCFGGGGGGYGVGPTMEMGGPESDQFV